LQELRGQFERVGRARHLPIPDLVLVYVALGEKDKALGVLEELQRYGTPHALYLKAYPPYDPLRAKPRFRELERVMGLL
jgi:hypothetical protein